MCGSNRHALMLRPDKVILRPKKVSLGTHMIILGENIVIFGTSKVILGEKKRSYLGQEETSLLINKQIRVELLFSSSVL